jgi:hypothetical protein
MADIKYYKWDVGTTLRVSTGNVLTTATVTNLKVQKPDGTEVEWVGTVDPGDNTVITYVVQANDFDQSGRYKLQAYVEFPSGKWRGNTAQFTVTTPFK